MEASAAFQPGLEGVLAAETALSDVDGEKGQLVIAGVDVEALTGRVGFEHVVGSLWHQAPDVVKRELGEGRMRAHALLPSLGGALGLDEPMDALRAGVAQLPSTTTAAHAVAAVGVFAAAWSRRRAGLEPLAPSASESHAADLLRLIIGSTTPALAAALDAYLVTVIDHGLNASTFTARVIASTGSDLVSCLAGALGALKGPLHGGAPGPVLDMLDAVGEPSCAETWLEAELAAGRRIMGMGHRIYRVRDPRAAVLERAVEQLEQAGVKSPRLALARAVERAARGVLARRYPTRSLEANVEFYTAVLLDTVGLPRALFTPLFAASRTSGWCAHVVEERQVGRLIRPASRYVGPRAQGTVTQ